MDGAGKLKMVVLGLTIESKGLITQLQEGQVNFDWSSTGIFNKTWTKRKELLNWCIGMHGKAV